MEKSSISPCINCGSLLPEENMKRTNTAHGHYHTCKACNAKATASMNKKSSRNKSNNYKNNAFNHPRFW